MAIDNARSYNMPNENIERAIKRASGDAEVGKLEEFVFDAYGPGNIALLIEGITDNKNRALGEVKKILTQYNGKMVQEGAVKWMFERKGYISIKLEEQADDFKNKEKLELAAIEAGAEDVDWKENVLDVYVKIEDLETVKKNLEEKEIKVDSSGLDWRSKEELNVSEKEKESCQKLFEALDENDNVQDIYSNLKA
jgi:YebC/PmpR family DNA-binding regulatory protein